jgi:branched-chain amino acid transport system ATP-binding protein
VLELNGISSGYGSAVAIRDISLSVGINEIVAIVGPNGAGKSTLLRTISGLLPCRTGTKAFDGVDVTRAGVTDLVRHGIIHVPEGRRLFGPLTVFENLQLGCYARRGEMSAGQIRERMDEVFQLFPALAGRRTQVARTLSGGEQQMLAIGRGLMGMPRVLLLDEPTLGLAPVVRQELARIITKLNQLGTGVLLIEENVELALGAANRVCLLDLGVITLQGRPAEVRDDPKMKAAYLGQSMASGR